MFFVVKRDKATRAGTQRYIKCDKRADSIYEGIAMEFFAILVRLLLKLYYRVSIFTDLILSDDYKRIYLILFWRYKMADFTNKVTVEFSKGEMTFWDERGYTEDNIPDVFFADVTVFDKDTGEQGEFQLEIHEGECIEFWEGKNFNDAMIDEQRIEQIFEALCFYESEGRYQTDFPIDWQVEIGNTMTATFNFKETV